MIAPDDADVGLAHQVGQDLVDPGAAVAHVSSDDDLVGGQVSDDPRDSAQEFEALALGEDHVEDGLVVVEVGADQCLECGLGRRAPATEVEQQPGE